MNTNNSPPYKTSVARGIKSWAEDDRPREKMLSKSQQALSDAELLAVIIGSGSTTLSAVELAREILVSVSNNLTELGKLSITELMRFKGIGEAKASNITAAMELGRRRRLAEGLQKRTVRSSRDAFEIIDPIIGDMTYEEFWLIMLNRANRVQRTLRVSEGSIAGTVADPKKIFKMAVDNYAAAIVLCHNHPSGQVHPSTPDRQLTEKCKQAGQFLEIPVMDHIIVGNNTYFSFADEGLI